MHLRTKIIRILGGDKEAQYNLGICYYNGHGVTQDYFQSTYWWKKATEKENILLIDNFLEAKIK